MNPRHSLPHPPWWTCATSSRRAERDEPRAKEEEGKKKRTKKKRKKGNEGEKRKGLAYRRGLGVGAGVCTSAKVGKGIRSVAKELNSRRPPILARLSQSDCSKLFLSIHSGRDAAKERGQESKRGRGGNNNKKKNKKKRKTKKKKK
jgi:hypothetical protein